MPRSYQSLPDLGWRLDAWTNPGAGRGAGLASFRTAGTLSGASSAGASGSTGGGLSAAAADSCRSDFFRSQTVFSTFEEVRCSKRNVCLFDSSLRKRTDIRPGFSDGVWCACGTLTLRELAATEEGAAAAALVSFHGSTAEKEIA